jgi:hypothetical protein
MTRNTANVLVGEGWRDSIEALVRDRIRNLGRTARCARSRALRSTRHRIWCGCGETHGRTYGPSANQPAQPASTPVESTAITGMRRIEGMYETMSSSNGSQQRARLR